MTWPMIIKITHSLRTATKYYLQGLRSLQVFSHNTEYLIIHHPSHSLGASLTESYCVLLSCCSILMCQFFKAVGSSRGIAQTQRVINYLEQSDVRAASAEAAAQAESEKVSQELPTDKTMLVNDSVS